MTNNPETRRQIQTGPCELKRAVSSATVVRLEELLQGSRELQIKHGHSIYRLMLTRNDRLILQK